MDAILGNLRRQSVTPFHGAQKYSYPLAGAALTIVRLPLPEFFRPRGGS